MEHGGVGSLYLQLGKLDQQINLIGEPRHLGGMQWYFLCPVAHQRACALWCPSGAGRFASRRAWGRQVAYRSQFETPTNRAHLGIRKIKSKLIAEGDPDEWDYPDKPKWMRWHTYDRHIEKIADYKEMLDDVVSKYIREMCC